MLQKLSEMEVLTYSPWTFTSDKIHQISYYPLTSDRPRLAEVLPRSQPDLYSNENTVADNLSIWIYLSWDGSRNTGDVDSQEKSHRGASLG